MRKLDVADVAALACELLQVTPADLLEVLDVERVAGILASPAATAIVPHEAAAGLLHGFLAHPPVPHLGRRLALLVAVHSLARAGLDIDLEPEEETRKHLQDIAIGAATLERTIAWLDSRVTTQGQEGEMFERFSAGARQVLVLAQEEARLLGHGAVGTEHLLLGLLHGQEGPAAYVLAASGISLEDARREAAAITTPSPAPPDGRPFTPRMKKVLELALRESLQQGDLEVGAPHLLLGLLREGAGVDVPVVRTLGGDPGGMREALLRLIEVDARVADQGHVEPCPAESPEDVEIVEAYLAGRAQQRRLTRDDEVRLGQMYEAGRAAQAALEQANDDVDLDREQVQQLQRQRDEGEEARRILVESHLHLSAAIAPRYRSFGVPMPELIEAGNEGLKRALEKFDWRKGYPFATYATWWIKQAMTHRIGQATRPPPASPEPPVALGGAPSPAQIERILEGLDPGELEVIRMRFGLGGGGVHALDEVAAHFGISREQVRKIEARTMELLLRRRPP